MKHFRFLLCSILLAAAAQISAQFDCAKSIQTDKFYRSDRIVSLMRTYGNSIDSLAMSSVEFGGDTETQWASDTIHTIWENRLSQPFDFLQTWADIMLMQRYFAYGVDYLPSVFCHSKYFQYMEDGGYTSVSFLRDSYAHTDSLYERMAEQPDAATLMELSAHSLTCVDIFFLLHDDLNETDSSPMMMSLYNRDAVDSLRTYQTPAVLLTYEWYLDGAAAFQTYCQFIIRTCPGEERWKEVQSQVIPHAMNMDKYAEPVKDIYFSHSPFPPVKAADFQQFVEQNLEMRIALARILKGNFLLLRDA